MYFGHIVVAYICEALDSFKDFNIALLFIVHVCMYILVYANHFGWCGGWRRNVGVDIPTM